MSIVPLGSLSMLYMITPAYAISPRIDVISVTFWIMVAIVRSCTNALGTARQCSVALRHVHHDQKRCRRYFYDL